MWKDLLLSTYYHTTLPLRRMSTTRDISRGAVPISVLFFHRIADEEQNAWTMPCATFAQHIQWLKHHFDLISLAEAQRRLVEGVNSRPAVCITFDDGYGDNCACAIPLLVNEQIPCTYFVASKFVLEGLPFPHDVARSQPLRPNTVDELLAMAKAGIEIGAHTRTHCDLGKIHDKNRLRDEIVDAAHELEDAVQSPIRYFSFPYGLHQNMTAEAFHLARRAGYQGVCSAYGGYNLPGDDAFHLQRIHADPDELRFKNWLTIDPRKRRVKRFEYAEVNDSSLATATYQMTNDQ